ncbi:SRPBCC family protein [Nocardioides pocheonensis]|uniref:SRPBCC family protein n=1 Tax=Nocardioides pocheonensis TaxID=661485 RepID=A0A3N0GGT1_9ACTN|nr:SRPBCC family protein [Nocardioides pocheonensis]RNM11674.1 SRPBCC family protein [Nocardioides pocheonensis]
MESWSYETGGAMQSKWRPGVAGAAVAAAAEVGLIHLGRTYGSTAEERDERLPGDDLVPHATVQTDHAITIDAPPSAVWPWLVQMGWGRGAWYTARWVDRLLFPDNGPSADRIVPALQDISVGTFIPDGKPETKTGLYVVALEPERVLVLRSNSHLPMSWRDRATLDWTWTFVLTPIDDGRRTRYHFRSRWVTTPWWFSLGGWLGIVPADFVMSRDHLRNVKKRAEQLALAA